MLYILIVDFLIPKLQPQNKESAKFAIQLLSNAIIEKPKLQPKEEVKEEIKPKEEKPIKEEKKPKEKPLTKDITEKVIEDALKEKARKEKEIKSTKKELQKKKEQEIKKIQDQKAKEEQEKRQKALEEKRKKDLITPVTEVIYEEEELGNASPKYPVISRKEGEEGEVILLVKVDGKGVPIDIIVFKSSGFERLDNASMYAVKNWKFKPAKNKFDEGVEAVIKIPFVFKIK